MIDELDSRLIFERVFRHEEGMMIRRQDVRSQPGDRHINWQIVEEDNIWRDLPLSLAASMERQYDERFADKDALRELLAKALEASE